MPPKKRVAGAKAKAKASPSAAASSSTGAPAGRWLRRNTTEEIASKSLRDNFGAWDDHSKFVHKVEGQTLYDRVVQDVRAKRQGRDVTMGMKYYQRLNRQFLPRRDPRRALAAPEQTQPIRKALMDGIIPTQRERPCHKLMTTTVGGLGADLNRSELVGVLRWGLSLRPTVETQLISAKVFLKYLARIHIKDTGPADWAIVKGWVDDTLVTAYLRHKQHKKKLPAFIQSHRDLLHLLLPEADLTQVQEVVTSGDYSEVMNNIRNVVNAGRIGTSMFSFALVQSVGLDLAARISKIMDEVFVEGPLTVQAYGVGKVRAHDHANAMPNLDLLPVRRQVDVSYGRNTVKASVGGILAEANLRFSARLKSCGVQCRKLPRLWCEDLLRVPLPAEAPKGAAIPADELLVDATVARAECKSDVEEHGASTGDLVLTCVTTRKASWLNSDADFLVEISIMETLTGPASETTLLAKMLTHMPSPATARTVQEAFTAIEGMSSTAAFRLATRSAQAKHGIVSACLGRALDNRPADLATMSGDINMNALKAAMAFFVLSSAGTNPPTYGTACLDAKLAPVQARQATGGALTQADVRELEIWQDLLSSENRAIATALIKTVNEAGGCHRARGAGRRRQAPQAQSLHGC